MELKIDEASMKEVVQKAILDQIGEEGRDKLVTDALVYLLQPSKNGYGGPISPLQESFNRAIGQAANVIVNDIVMNDPVIQQKIKEMVGEAFIKMEATNFTYYLSAALHDALNKAYKD